MTPNRSKRPAEKRRDEGSKSAKLRPFYLGASSARSKQDACQPEAQNGRTPWALTEGDSLLLAHSGNDGDEEVLSVIESLLDLVSNLALRELDIVLGGSVGRHHVEEAVIDCGWRDSQVSC